MKIVVLDDWQHVAEGLADWGSIPGAEVTFFHDHVADPDALAQRLADYDVVQMMRERTPLSAAVMERLPGLKHVAGTGRRLPNIDMDAATRLGIVVTGSGGSGGSTPELAWGLIIAVMRHIPWEDAQMRLGNWQTRLGPSLAGKTLGILGMGRIGTRMAVIAQAFEMKVIAWGPTLTPERAQASGATYVSWDELFQQADVLSIHVPLTDLSRGWVTERELGLMEPTAYLINTSRGPIVREDAMIDALRHGRIAGAGLDVYDQEPLPKDHPLLGLENTVLAPHLGYAAFDGMQSFYREAVENIKAWAAGTPVNVLNEDVLSRARRP